MSIGTGEAAQPSGFSGSLRDTSRAVGSTRSLCPFRVGDAVSQATRELTGGAKARSLTRSGGGAILPRVSAENVELVRRWQAAISASLEEALASGAELWDSDADYYPVRKFPEARPCHGLEELSQFLTRYLEAFSSYEWAIREVIAVGDDRVLVCASWRAEGRESGVKLEGDLYQCYWLRHSRFFRVEDHMTLRGALHALGLQGETLEAAGLRDQP
jgi:SnoaL-like protein